MLRKLLNNNRGQAVAELGLALMILLPLIFWMLRLGDLLNMKHQMIEAARFAVWEKTHGRPDSEIKRMIETDIKSGTLFYGSALQVNTALGVESSKNDFTVFSVADAPAALGLRYDNYFLSRIEARGKTPFGFDYTVTENYAMLGDSWNLTDRDGDQKVTDKDLQASVKGLYFWAPWIGNYSTAGLNTILDKLDDIQNNSIVKFLASWSGQQLDLDPRGHPRLDQVPPPSGRR